MRAYAYSDAAAKAYPELLDYLPIVHCRIESRLLDFRGLYTLTLFVMSDAYLGIDQEYSFQCHVTN